MLAEEKKHASFKIDCDPGHFTGTYFRISVHGDPGARRKSFL
jgi:hypothetical protein